jgi:hypothetical protein
MNRVLLLTLDLEEDGGAAARTIRYECAERASLLSELLEREGLTLTVFVSGRLLSERPDLIDLFDRERTIFENHGYDHRDVHGSAAARRDNLLRGHEAYEAFFRCAPRGYRAPNGIIGPEELRALHELGYRYDSSVFPTWFPGRYRHSRCPSEDFVWADLDLLECPVSVTSYLRVPLGVSFMQILGWPVYRRLLGRRAWPARLLVDFHLHDLVPGAWYEDASLGYRLAYRRARSSRPMHLVFQRLLEACAVHGYASTDCRSHAERLLSSSSTRLHRVPVHGRQ